MCGSPGMTIRMVKLKIRKHFAIFRIITDNVATFKYDGILGTEFFWEEGGASEFDKEHLKVGESYFKFLLRDTCEKLSGYWLERAKKKFQELIPGKMQKWKQFPK